MLLAITSRTDSYLQFLTVLLLFVFVLVITYFTTRWIARYPVSYTHLLYYRIPGSHGNYRCCNIDLTIDQ